MARVTGPDAYVALQAHRGSIDVRDTRITSWDAAANGRFHDNYFGLSTFGAEAMRIAGNASGGLALFWWPATWNSAGGTSQMSSFIEVRVLVEGGGEILVGGAQQRLGREPADPIAGASNPPGPAHDFGSSEGFGAGPSDRRSGDRHAGRSHRACASTNGPRSNPLRTLHDARPTFLTRS